MGMVDRIRNILRPSRLSSALEPKQEFTATPAEMPEQGPERQLGVTIAVEPPVGTVPLAGSFPRWADPARDDLKPEAYTLIRRTFETSYPVVKLGTQLAALQWKVVGDGPKAERMQEIVDLIPGKSAAIRGLTWGLVEGWRALFMVWRPKQGFFIPRLDPRRKEAAGGSFAWDGQNMVMIERFPRSARITGTRADDLEPQRVDRRRLVFWQHTPSESPEGDDSLAWIMYLLCEDGQETRKVLNDYTTSHAMPLRIYKLSTEHVRSVNIANRKSTAAQKLEQAKRATVAISAKDAIENLEPNGTSANFLTDRQKGILETVHMMILHNVLTSQTQDAGPTGSSTVQKGEQDSAVTCVAASMAEALSADLLPVLTYYNSIHLLPLEGQVERIELVPAASAEPAIKTSATEKLDAVERGLPMAAESVYGAFGEVVPPDVPDMIDAAFLKEHGAKEEQPFGGGFGGGFGSFEQQQPSPFGGNPFGQGDPFADLEAEEAEGAGNISPLSARVKWSRADDVDFAQLNAFEDDTADVERSEMAGMVEVTDKAIERLAQGMELPPTFAAHLAEVFARAHLAGAQRFRNTLPIGVRNRLAAAESGQPMLKLRGDSKALSELALLYRRIAVDAAKIATRTLQERLTSNLARFLEAQPEATPADSKEFVSWMRRNTQTSDAYARLVLRNGVNSAYSAGRQQEFSRIAPVFGLQWRFVTSADRKVRDDHEDHEGAVFPNLLRWRRKMPPVDHNCRCSWTVTTDPAWSTERLEALPTLGWEDTPVSLRLPQRPGLGITSA